MPEAKIPLANMEKAVQRFDQILTVMVVLFAMNAGGKSAYDGLASVENTINAVNDPQLSSLYKKTLEAFKDEHPHKEYLQNEEYKQFMGRLNSMMIQSAVHVNEADIALREAVGADATEGMWGPKGWRPDGKVA